jgi:hypothetical protein
MGPLFERTPNIRRYIIVKIINKGLLIFNKLITLGCIFESIFQYAKALPLVYITMKRYNKYLFGFKKYFANKCLRPHVRLIPWRRRFESFVRTQRNYLQVKLSRIFTFYRINVLISLVHMFSTTE